MNKKKIEREISLLNAKIEKCCIELSRAEGEDIIFARRQARRILDSLQTYPYFKSVLNGYDEATFVDDMKKLMTQEGQMRLERKK